MVLLISISFVFLLIRLTVTVLNSIFLPFLPKKEYTKNELVSILIPCRNEEKNIYQTLISLLSQNYPYYEVIVIDDFSEDNTVTEIEKAIKKYDEKSVPIRLIKGTPLPVGWLGKNWACHQLAQEAKGTFFLFIDADVIVGKQLLSHALTELESKKLSLLSIFPDQIFTSWGERITVPIMHYLLLTMLPMRLIYESKFPSLAAANGQFMLFRADTYKTYFFHEKVKNKVTEDIEIVKFIKKTGLKDPTYLCANTYLGNSEIHCNMYKSWHEAVKGFSKNLLAGFGNVFGLLIYIVLTIVAPILMLFWSVIWFGSYVGLVVIMNMLLARLSHQPLLTNIVLHPLKIGTLLIISVKSIYGTFTKSIEWKGRKL
jgi:chlorobactene glucosyltransferase